MLQSRTEELRRNGTPELPPVRALCAQAGVSYATMQRALRALSDAGELEVVQGRRTRIPGVAVDGPGPVASTPRKWLSLAEAIRRDLLTGVLPPDRPLPPRAELSTRYGASAHTLRKALGSLIADGLLHETGRTLHTVGQLRASRSHGTIVYILRSRGGGLPMVFASRNAEIARGLDEECARRGVRLRISYCHAEGRRIMFPDGWLSRTRRSIQQESILGFIVDRTSIHRQMPELIPALARHGVPVSVMMDSPEASSVVGQLPPRADVSLIRFLLDRLAGRAIGRHLLAMGHRRIAYLGPSESVHWSRERIGGLRESMACAGPDATVEHFRADPHPGDETSDRRKLLRAIDRAMRSIVRSAVGPGFSETAFLRRFRDSTLDYQPFMFRVPLWWLHGFEDTATRLLQRRDITAWVCGNENSTLLADDFLQANGRRIPEDISVVGFDDVQETLARRLTMYSFRPRAAVEAALNCILNPRLAPGALSGVRDVYVEGEVRERGSVGVTGDG